jgi:hypothetical protein
MAKSSCFKLDCNVKLHYQAMDEGDKEGRARSAQGISRMLLRKNFGDGGESVVMPIDLCK